MNYAEVVFQTSSTAPDHVIIRGQLNKTVYAEVDLLARVTALPDSQSESSSSDADFVYVDGLENYMDKMKEMDEAMDLAN